MKLIKGTSLFQILLLLVFLGAFMAFGLYAIGKYTDAEKRGALSTVYSEVKSKTVKYLLENGKMPSSPEIVGIKSIDYLMNTDTEKSANFKIERRIELTPNQIVITLGPEFDGDEEKTFILQATSSRDGVNWSCKKGNLSNKYRPSECRN